ncbi:specific transcriptional repressor [Coprinopsis cinerea AmutBmut pab1-1]|nr:specific transcriptional repressor [Coprinopsis cinerea AmutBmut pab1-1]
MPPKRSRDNDDGDDKGRKKDDNNKNTPARPAKRQKKKKNEIPRPSNAFMIYRRERQQRFEQEALEMQGDGSDPKSTFGHVSRCAGAAWRNESEEVRSLYFAKAEQEKKEHKKLYPDYKFNREKRGKRSAKKKLDKELEDYQRQCSPEEEATNRPVAGPSRHTEGGEASSSQSSTGAQRAQRQRQTNRRGTQAEQGARPPRSAVQIAQQTLLQAAAEFTPFAPQPQAETERTVTPPIQSELSDESQHANTQEPGDLTVPEPVPSPVEQHNTPSGNHEPQALNTYSNPTHQQSNSFASTSAHTLDHGAGLTLQQAEGNSNPVMLNHFGSTSGQANYAHQTQTLHAPYPTRPQQASLVNPFLSYLTGNGWQPPPGYVGQPSQRHEPSPLLTDLSATPSPSLAFLPILPSTYMNHGIPVNYGSTNPLPGPSYSNNHQNTAAADNFDDLLQYFDPSVFTTQDTDGGQGLGGSDEFDLSALFQDENQPPSQYPNHSQGDDSDGNGHYDGGAGGPSGHYNFNHFGGL